MGGVGVAEVPAEAGVDPQDAHGVHAGTSPRAVPHRREADDGAQCPRAKDHIENQVHPAEEGVRDVAVVEQAPRPEER